MATELTNFRAKYPQYSDVDDNTLANMLAKKFPDAYGDLPSMYPSSQAQPMPSNITKSGVLGGPETLGQMPEVEPDASIIPAALTIGTGAIAEPVAGLAGIAGSILPGESGQGERFIEKTREAMTFKPRSEEGVEALQKVGKVVEPVARAIKKVESGLGDKAFELTGSPAIAALATTAPTLLTEIIGYGIGKGALKSLQRSKVAKAKGEIATAIEEAVPDVDQIKTTAREIYKEIDDTGALVKKEAVNDLIGKIKAETKKAGLDPRITPKAAAAVNAIEEVADKAISVTELDTLRKVAKNAITPNDPAESSLALRIVNNIDDFLDKAGKGKIVTPNKADMPNIGRKYKVARDLWGRARKSELLSESFEKARNQASGFENGLRTQFRSILNNKNKRKFFNKNDIDAMTKVVRGGRVENMAKLVGRLGFSEGGATNILGGAVGVGGGAAVGGPVGAVLVPLVGQVSRKLAQRMTRKGAEFADQVIRAGKDAEKITQAYLRNTPKAQRTAQELSELLMKQDIDISRLPNIDLIGDAKSIVDQNRKALVASVAGEDIASQLGDK